MLNSLVDCSSSLFYVAFALPIPYLLQPHPQRGRGSSLLALVSAAGKEGEANSLLALERRGWAATSPPGRVSLLALGKGGEALTSRFHPLRLLPVASLQPLLSLRSK
jgi:hypothetical protein